MSLVLAARDLGLWVLLLKVIFTETDDSTSAAFIDSVQTLIGADARIELSGCCCC